MGHYGLKVCHYSDIIMGTMASQITSLTVVYSTVYSGADQRKHQSSASLTFVREIHRGPVNSPHKGPVTRKMFPFDDVIMVSCILLIGYVNWFSMETVQLCTCGFWPIPNIIPCQILVWFTISSRDRISLNILNIFGLLRRNFTENRPFTFWFEFCWWIINIHKICFNQFTSPSNPC